MNSSGERNLTLEFMYNYFIYFLLQNVGIRKKVVVCPFNVVLEHSLRDTPKDYLIIYVKVIFIDSTNKEWKTDFMKLSFKLLILSGRETVIFCLLEKVTSEGIVLLPCNTLTSSVPTCSFISHFSFKIHKFTAF